MQAEKDSTPQSSSNVHHLPNCTHQNEWVPDPGLWQGWDGRSIMMLEPSGFCGDRGPGLLALCSIMPRGPFYPFSAPRPTGQSWSHKRSFQNQPDWQCSFQNHILYVSFPPDWPPAGTRSKHPKSFVPKICRWNQSKPERLELANLVKIPRLSSDENRRIRFGESLRWLSSRAHRSRQIQRLSRKKYIFCCHDSLRLSVVSRRVFADGG